MVRFKANNTQTRKSNKIDRYLTSWKHWWIAVAIVTVFYWIVFSSRQDLFLPLFFGILTVWLYISIRKYGLLETLTFVGILPFIFLGALMTLFFKSLGSSELDYETFIEAALEEIEHTYNEVYVGKIIDVRTEEEKVYITVEAPYGLHVPVSEMIADIAEHLRISPAHIQTDPISEGRIYYVFGLDAVMDYEKSKKTPTPYQSFTEIKDRMLCKSPATINPLTLQE